MDVDYGGPKLLDRRFETIQSIKAIGKKIAPCCLVLRGASLGEKSDLMTTPLHFPGGDEGIGLRTAKAAIALMDEK